MFEVELRSSETDKGFATERLGELKKVLECISDIVEQMEIKCKDSGMHIQVMDALHVALAEVFFSRDAFSTYRCDRELQIVVPTKHFLTILRGMNLDERSVLRISCEDNPDSLKVEHHHPDLQYEFNISLYKVGKEYYDIPQMSYDLVVKMPSEQFRSIAKLIGSFGDYISFECDGGRLHVRQRADLVKNNMTLASNGESVVIESTAPVCQEIAMKYINLVCKISVLSESIKANFGADSPVFFEVEIGKMGYVRFYIAPKAPN